MGLRVSYTSVGTVDQEFGVPLDHLAEMKPYFAGKTSSRSAKSRPELKSALGFVREKDFFVVTNLDRLAHSFVDLWSFDLRYNPDSLSNHFRPQVVSLLALAFTWGFVRM